MRANKNLHSLTPQTGFTLIEIMVGMVIGLLATIVIMQVFSVFEAQKRTTTGTADAQTNGSIALFDITRDLQMAGYPFMPIEDSAFECSAVTIDGTAGFNHSSLSPVTITNGTSDTLTIRYGDAASGGAPSTITALVGNDVTVGSNLGCSTGGRTLVINGSTCAFSIASGVSASSAPPATVTLANTSVAAVDANLSCIGNWNTVTYAVNNGNLERGGQPAIPEVVNLQAQYGVSDTPNSNQVTAWVDPTGTWLTPTIADRNRIKAIRIAVVARNSKMEPSNVTGDCSTTTGAAPTGLCAWEGTAASPAPTIFLGADANWKRYRYRVFETIIPLRNVIWAKGTL
ncbi:MAG: PilW family protein [Sideroxydans sp.]|jgi:type IV pilus assembly protein PilW